MAKFKVKVEWTQYLSIEREVEADDLTEAAELAAEIDPNGDINPAEIVFGDIVSEVEASIDGEVVAVDNCTVED